MKSIDIKFSVSLGILTVGLVLLCVDVRWLFFVGFTMVMLQGLLAYGYQPRALSVVGHIVYVAIFIAVMWRFGFEQPPMIYLILVWLIIAGQEFYRWRKYRVLTRCLN
jgi:hypothetical protein